VISYLKLSTLLLYLKSKLNYLLLTENILLNKIKLIY